MPLLRFRSGAYSATPVLQYRVINAANENRDLNIDRDYFT